MHMPLMSIDFSLSSSDVVGIMSHQNHIMTRFDKYMHLEGEEINTVLGVSGVYTYVGLKKVMLILVKSD